MKKFAPVIIIFFLAQNSIAQNVGIGTTTPKASFNVAADKTVLFGTDTSGAGSKLIWYPSKNAFRAGLVVANSNNVGLGSFAAGYNNLLASGVGSTALGAQNTASGDYATALGLANIASGRNATSMGANNNASGSLATSMGFLTTASGGIATSMGYQTNAKSGYETVVGVYNTDYTPLSATGWNALDRLFTIGNGSVAANAIVRSDAMVVLKNGNTGIGTSAPDARLTVAGNTSEPQIKIYQATGTDFARLRLANNNGNTNNRFWDIAGIIGTGDESSDRLNFFNVTGGNVLSLTGNGNAGIGTADPKSTLEVKGTFATSVVYKDNLNESVSLDNSASVWIVSNSSNIILPNSSVCPSRRYTIVNRNNFALQVSSYVGLNGSLLTTIPAFSSIELISGGASWEQLR